jgi:hypothetical protein
LAWGLHELARDVAVSLAHGALDLFVAPSFLFFLEECTLFTAELAESAEETRITSVNLCGLGGHCG